MLFSLFGAHKPAMPSLEESLPGRPERPFKLSGKHVVNGRSILPPFPAGMELAQFGLGCFWGAERKFWQAPGVYATAVGYAGGHHARTRPTRRSARAAPATPRRCWSCSTRRRPATRRC